MLTLQTIILQTIIIGSKLQYGYSHSHEKDLSQYNFDKLIMDVSEDCTENYTTSVRLSYGSGSTDARVILLRSLPSDQNCSVLVVASDRGTDCGNRKCVIIAVIELFSYELKKSLKSICSEAVFTVGDHDLRSEICNHVGESDLIPKYKIFKYLIREKNSMIQMAFKAYSGTVKITVTSAKYLGSRGHCIASKELRCIIDDKKICISNLLICDGNQNCGIPGKYDEYCIKYPDREYVLYIVIYGLFIVSLIILFFVQILRVCIPNVAEHFFIFNEGEENKFVLATQSLRPLEAEKANMRGMYHQTLKRKEEETSMNSEV